MAEHISGVAVATITPFIEGDGIDYGFIEAHLAMLEREGAHGIVPVGTNGEFPSMTLAEKKMVLEVSAAARGTLFMIAGTGSCSIVEAIELTRFSEEIGADAVLVVPPFYYSDVSEVGVIEFYRRVLAATALPVFLYNIPVYSGVFISDRIIDALLPEANLAGVKDTGGDPTRTRELIRNYPQLKIFGGSDSLVGEAVDDGAAGIISGAGNVFPALLREAWDSGGKACDSRGRGCESEAARQVRELRSILKTFPWVAATKAALSLRGLPQTLVRPPLLDLNDTQMEDLRQRLKAMELI